MGDRSQPKAEGIEGASGSSATLSDNADDDRMPEFLLSVRAAERRRIEQELHDSALQILALVQLNLGRLRRLRPEELEAPIVECEELIAQIGRELRAICDPETPSPEVPAAKR